MIKTVEVILHNKDGRPTEIIMPFSDFPHPIRIKLGEKIKMQIPVTSRLADYRRLVIKRNKNGDSAPTPTYKRSKIELRKIEQARRDENEKELPHLPRDFNSRRGMLNKLGEKL